MDYRVIGLFNIEANSKEEAIAIIAEAGNPLDYLVEWDVERVTEVEG